MKFPSNGEFSELGGRAVRVMQRATWAQHTKICHSLGFNCGLIHRIVCRFHKGAIFLCTLQNWFITLLYSKTAAIIKASIARSGAISLSRLTSYIAFETFFFLLSRIIWLSFLFFPCFGLWLYYLNLPYIARNKDKDIQLSASALRLNCISIFKKKKRKY